MSQLLGGIEKTDHFSDVEFKIAKTAVKSSDRRLTVPCLLLISF